MNIFSLQGKNAVVLGGAGILGRAMVCGLAQAGASVAIAGRTQSKCEHLAAELAEQGFSARGYQADTTDEARLSEAAQKILADFGQIDILVNAVGGNRPEATVGPDASFFDISTEAFKAVVDLNLFGGVVLPSIIFGKSMAANAAGGSIINISSMAAILPLTRVVGYSASKAAVNSFTQWMAVEMAQKGYTNLRVNAIAPGFFLTEQNRFLLTDKDSGELTARGKTIQTHTPMGRFGEPDELVGATVWLASDASKFVTGIVVPVDGGFSAFSGV